MASRKEVSSIASATNLPPSAKGDHTARMRKYLISMSIRTLCFVLAVVFTGPLRWIFVVFAVVLPYIAVVVANATGTRPTNTRGSVRPEEQIKQLRAGHNTP